jgi:hypothetical protein
MRSLAGAVLGDRKRVDEDVVSMRRGSLRFLLEEQTPTQSTETPKKAKTAMQRSTLAMKSLASKMEKGFPNTSKLIDSAGVVLTKAIASGGEDNETIALFLLASQFGASLMSLLNNVNEALETDSKSADSSIADTLGKSEVANVIKKTFKPSPDAFKAYNVRARSMGWLHKIQQAGEATRSDDVSEGSDIRDVFEIGNMQDLDEASWEDYIGSAMDAPNQAMSGVKAAPGALKTALSSLRHGAGNIARYLLSKSPPSVEGTVRALMPLFGGKNILPAILEDMTSDTLTGKVFGETLNEISPSLNELAPGTTEKVNVPKPADDSRGTEEERKDGAPTNASVSSAATDNQELINRIADLVAKRMGTGGEPIANAVRDIGAGKNPNSVVQKLGRRQRAVIRRLFTTVARDGTSTNANQAVAKALSNEEADKESSKEGKATLSSILFQKAGKKKTGTKGKFSGEDAKRKKIDQAVRNLSNAWDVYSGNDTFKPDQRKNIVAKFKDMNDTLTGVTIESRSSDDNRLILERWQVLAGLGD